LILISSLFYFSVRPFAHKNVDDYWVCRCILMSGRLQGACFYYKKQETIAIYNKALPQLKFLRCEKKQQQHSYSDIQNRAPDYNKCIGDKFKSGRKI